MWRASRLREGAPLFHFPCACAKGPHPSPGGAPWLRFACAYAQARLSQLWFDLLSETGKLGVKPCGSPMVPSVHLTREDEKFEDPERYRRPVGKLNYLTVTCPDIAYSISVVSQHMSSLTIDHWAVVE